MRKSVILIGGAPTTGKSFVAQQLSRHLNLPWISTDQIREIMRTVARRKDFPTLFNPEGYTAERFLTEFTAEQIVRMEMAQGEAAWLGIRRFIADDYTWGLGCVVEGVNILPHLVAKDFGDDRSVRAVFLVDEDADRIRNVVFTRGVWDDAHTYADDVKEKEVVWALLFGRQLKSEAKRFGFPCIEVKKNSDDLAAVLEVLGLPAKAA